MSRGVAMAIETWGPDTDWESGLGGTVWGEMNYDPELCDWLREHGIAFERFDHPPVFTCDEADRLVPAAAAAVQTKNLFLRNKKGDRHWLLVTDCRTAVDLKALGPVIGAAHLSLGSPDRLQRYLGLTPGSVTVFGLVNDPNHQVSLLIDAAIDTLPAWRCHPMINSATLVVPREGIARFLELTGHEARVIRIPERQGVTSGE